MNPVAVDKHTKEFLYHKDSGFLFTKQLINALPKEWRYTVLVPTGFDRRFFPTDHVIECVPYDYCTSIHQNRYHFNRNILALFMSYAMDFDVVLNNQPESAANILTYFRVQRRENPLIINFFHWIDCKESAANAPELTGYIWRQIEGVLFADKSYFHTEHARKLFDDYVNTVVGKKFEYDYGCFHPLPTMFGDEKMELPQKKIILFNHRMRDTTGWKEVVDICIKLSKKRDDFVLWITDENIPKDGEFVKQYKFIMNKSVSANSYAYLMKNSHFSICNTKGYATWNMSVLDSVVNGCLPLVINKPLYHEMFPTGDIFFDDLGITIEKHLNNTREENVKKLNDVTIAEHDLSSIVDSIYKILRGRVENHNVAKYGSVVDFIKSENVLVKNGSNLDTFFSGARSDVGVCKKVDFVHGLWKWATNHTFQTIRWKLLFDGIKDDITQRETTYCITLEELEKKKN